MNDFLKAVRQLAAANPDQAHARALAALDPTWRSADADKRARLLGQTPRTFPVLNLSAARARRATASPSPTPEPPARRYTGPLNVGAVRAAREAKAAARRPPLAPGGALRFVASGSWRWVHIDSRLPSARSWLHLAASLVSAGPLLSLRVDQAETVPGAMGGHTRFHQGDDGTVWASIAIDPQKCGTSQHTERVLRHELAHVGDELAKLSTVTASTWWRSLTDPHREAQAEAFAISAEDWVTTRTTGAELIAAARAHQAGHRAR